jgi:tRNA A37 threonylcarbamoyladenosine synthetase subunit TsaC/SUA5/YrdC
VYHRDERESVGGKPAPATPSAIDAELASRIDAILDAGRAAGGPPSTIVRVVSGRLERLRDGAIEWDRVIRLAQ